jgi:indolepyruvate ferredoxin oxidoreductase beta subunit
MKNSMIKKKQLDAQIVICGRGGQGILFLTRLLDETAILLGSNVISSETHGMAMRGGSVTSHIRIGNYRSPLIPSGKGDFLLAVNESEEQFNRHLMKKGAQLYINSSACRPNAIWAEKIARELGAPMAANLVLLGFATAHADFPFQHVHIHAVLEKISPSKALEMNLRAFNEGYQTIAN